MKTQEEIKADELKAELKNIGINANYSVSNTDYGTSCYFTFYKNSDSTDKYVIRISDHSVTNITRIATERHENANSINISKVANAVELYLFPNRFEFIATSEAPTHRINGVFGKYNSK